MEKYREEDDNAPFLPKIRRNPKRRAQNNNNNNNNPDVLMLQNYYLGEAAKVISIPSSSTSAPTTTNAISKKSNVKSRIEQAKAVYRQESRRLKSLRRKQKKILKKPEPVIKYRAIDDLMRMEQLQHKSSIMIQRCYLTYRRRKFWKQLLSKVRAATTIQKVARGMLIRIFVREWYLQKGYIAQKIQRFIRGCQARYVWNTVIQWEGYNATIIQRNARGFFGRRRFKATKRTVAIIHLQSQWRGYVGRRTADRIWLSTKACKIQRSFKRFRTMNAVKEMKSEYYYSATLISKRYKGVTQRRIVRQLLLSREREASTVLSNVLRVEEVWHEERVTLLRRRLERSGIQDQIRELESTLKKDQELIREYEYALLELESQAKKASPRAIEQGWVSEASKNIKRMRDRMTEQKFETMFGVNLELCRAVDKLEKARREISYHDSKCLELEQWRSEELLDSFAFEAQQKAASEKKRKALAIAEQKRRWRIKFYTSDGKPDLRRRDGYPWDASVYASAEQSVNPSGLADLLAFCNGNKKSEFGDQFSTLMAKIQLVNSMASAKRTGTILDPMLNVVEEQVEKVRRQDGYVQPIADVMAARETSQMFRKARELVAQDDLTQSEEKKKKLAQRREEMLKRQEEKQARKDMLEVREEKSSAKVPWNLLDQLAAEKKKLAIEVSMHKIYGYRAKVT